MIGHEDTKAAMITAETLADVLDALAVRVRSGQYKPEHVFNPHFALRVYVSERDGVEIRVQARKVAGDFLSGPPSFTVEDWFAFQELVTNE